jgi:plastocyanin
VTPLPGRGSIRAAAVILAFGFGLTACSTGGATIAPVVAPSGSPSLVARDLKFDTSRLAVPAGQAFTLVFENEDGAPHNVAIYRDTAATDALFVGETFSGPAGRAYAVPALPAGTYLFRCDVHHDMQGQVVAAP